MNARLYARTNRMNRPAGHLRSCIPGTGACRRHGSAPLRCEASRKPRRDPVNDVWSLCESL